MTLAGEKKGWGQLNQVPCLPAQCAMPADRRTLQSRGVSLIASLARADVNAADDDWEGDDYLVDVAPVDAVADIQPPDAPPPGLRPEPAPAPIAQIDGLPPEVEPRAAESIDREADALDSIAEDFLLEAESEEVFAGPAIGDEHEPIRGVQGWQDEVELPDYDFHARVVPWTESSEDDELGLRKARLKAAALASALDVSTQTELREATDYLVELLTRRVYNSTYRELQTLASEGLDLDLLRAVVELRATWGSHRSWWVTRRADWDGRSGLTWRLARDVCVARSDYPPDHMIEEDWLAEWYSLRFGDPGWFSFAQFVAEKVGSTKVDALADGLRRMPGDHREAGEPGDRHSDIPRDATHPRPQ